MRRNSFLSFLKEKSFLIVLTLMLVSAGTMAVLFVFSGNDQTKDQEIAKGQEEIQLEIQAEKPPAEETKEDREELPKKAVVKRTTDTKEKLLENTASNTENAVLEAELEDQYLKAEELPEELAEVSTGDVIAEGFQENSLLTLSWPVEGEVILPFSMDRSVYFATLAQYQYNPAMIIGAEEGTEVLSAAKGTVIEVAKSSEYGHYVVVDLGDGYELTYGQLFDISTEVGETLQEGDRIAMVAYPTRSYMEEGENLYLKLTKDGTAVNPEFYLKK